MVVNLDNEKYEYLKMEDHFDRETLLELFSYNQNNGIFYWKRRDKLLCDKIGMTESAMKTFNTKCSDKPAGSLTKDGYIQLNMQLKDYMLFGLAHRLVWVIFNGKIQHQIDHLDGDRSNNRIENLRDVPQQDNTFNSKIRENNTSGVTGVSYRKQRSCWRAYYTLNGVQYVLGHYKNFEDAVKVRKEWEESSGYLFRL